MKIDKLVVGAIQTNCYIISSDKKNTILIDPGDEADKIIEFIDSNKLIVKYILLSHGHFDHVLALKELISKYPETEVCISERDVELVENIREQMGYVGLDSRLRESNNEEVGNDKYDGTSRPRSKNIDFDKFLQENDIIELDDLRIKIIETPGHTKGGISLLLNKEYLFTGDTLFKAGVGRTDLFGGDPEVLKKSLKKLLKLPDNIKVYPGHGEASAIGEERKNLDLN